MDHLKANGIEKARQARTAEQKDVLRFLHKTV